MIDPRHAEPLRPANAFQERDPLALYWIRDESVYYRRERILGADPATFVFFLGGFAKDVRHCYCVSSRLKGADPETFRALNFTYFKDADHVWTLGGALKDVDVDTIEVCDDGVFILVTGTKVPYGYARDRTRVYYYDYDGKPNPVRKADSATFTSLNDGHFGRDDQFVFCGGSVLPGARVASWRKIGGHYSSDGARIFYFNRRIRNADPASFERVPASPVLQLARDKTNFYWNDTPIEEPEFKRLLSEP